jgi:hypothetical protein
MYSNRLLCKGIQLKITKPCSERWTDFKPTPQGGYCSSCQKEVIDFTDWSEERLKAYFKNSPTGTCGRLKADQLKLYTFGREEAPVMRGTSLVFASVLLLLSSRQAAAQVSKAAVAVEQFGSDSNLRQEMNSTPDSVLKVCGIVTLYSDSSFLKGVDVLYKGAVMATTDEFGKFAFTLAESDSVKIIFFSYPGIRGRRHVIRPGQPQENLDIVMGAVTTHVVLGGAISVCVIRRPWYSPKRWWLGMKSWF